MSFVKDHLVGERNGKKTGQRLNTVAKHVVSVNENIKTNSGRSIKLQSFMVKNSG